MQTLTAAWLAGMLALAGSAPAMANDIQARCVGVDDAAHLRMQIGSRVETVTLIGVGDGAGTPCVAEGIELMRGLAVGHTLRLATDRNARDAAGQRLVYAYLPNGHLLNERPLSEGYARLAPLGANMAHSGELVAAQSNARTRHLCVWLGERPQPAAKHAHGPGSPVAVRVHPLGGGGGGLNRPPLNPPGWNKPLPQPHPARPRGDRAPGDQEPYLP